MSEADYCPACGRGDLIIRIGREPENPADALRRAAEDALIWQDEWDSQPSDGSAVQNFIDAASPRAVLAALDWERKAAERALESIGLTDPNCCACRDFLGIAHADHGDGEHHWCAEHQPFTMPAL